MNFTYFYDIAAVIVSAAVLITFFRKHTLLTKFVRATEYLILLVFFSSLTNVIAIFSLKYPENLSISWLYFINDLYFIFHSMISLTFVYVVTFAAIGNQTTGRKFQRLIPIPYMANLLLLLTTPFTHWIFYIDQNKGYCRGKLFFVLYILAFFYILLSTIIALKFRANFTRGKLLTIILTPLAIIGIVILWIFNQDLQLTSFALSVAILFLFIVLENPSVFIDSEMNIYNRVAFTTKFMEALDKNHKYTFLGINIVDLRFLNKTIGIKNEEELLADISKFFLEFFGKQRAYRISSNIFVIDLNLKNLGLEEYVYQLKERFRLPFRFGDSEITLSILTDYLNYPEDASTVNDVLDLLENSFSSEMNKENALITHVDKDIIKKSHREHKIVQLLEEAIKNDGFEIHYQPIYSIAKQRFTSAEALIRLKDDSLGYITPEEFIPIAEKNGLILEISKIELKQICEFLAENNLRSKGLEYLHINLSVIQCIQEDLCRDILQLFAFYKTDTSLINFEVTETTAIASSEILLNNMDMLKKKNISFSLDDFGSGYSNSNTLINYPFSEIKIDKSLVWTAMENPRVKVILFQTVSLIKNLGLKVVVEGIETEEQVEEILKMKVDFIQGYYYSKPLPQNEFIKKLEESN